MAVIPLRDYRNAILKIENPQENPTQTNQNPRTPAKNHHIRLGIKRSVLMQSQEAEIQLYQFLTCRQVCIHQ